jgi:large subunit ribosomal protein L3e
MSHRKFERPRHGSLGFLPRKRCRRFRGKIRAFPKDISKQAPHLTAFLGFKAGMTHVVRDLDRPGSKMHKKEVVESATILDCPPMVAIGFVGYKETAKGLKPIKTIWADHITQQAKRAFVRNWSRSKKKAFANHEKNLADPKYLQKKERGIQKIKRLAKSVRLIVSSQPKLTHLGQKKAHIMEVQINGGKIPQKVEFAIGLLESSITVDKVFKDSEMIDCIGVSKGHGFEGVIHRWGVTRLPRKTHKGLRKVACIGAWHPARVGYSVPRAGQNGFHHRVELNKKIFRIGKSQEVDKGNGKCSTDLTDKTITPMGGFVGYGIVRNDFIMIRGTVVGHVMRPITLRRPLHISASRASTEQVELKFIDTSTKFGHGKFQTREEKEKFLGTTKKSALKGFNPDAAEKKEDAPKASKSSKKATKA